MGLSDELRNIDVEQLKQAADKSLKRFIEPYGPGTEDVQAYLGSTYPNVTEMVKHTLLRMASGLPSELTPGQVNLVSIGFVMGITTIAEAAELQFLETQFNGGPEQPPKEN